LKAPGEHLLVEQSPRTAARVVDGHALVIVIDDRRLHSLNGVGTRVWELADGSKTIGQIADEIVREFDVTRDVALEHTIEFVQQLMSIGALRARDGT